MAGTCFTLPDDATMESFCEPSMKIPHMGRCCWSLCVVCSQSIQFDFLHECEILKMSVTISEICEVKDVLNAQTLRESDFSIGKFLGQGSYGKVMYAKLKRDSRQEFALKIMSKYFIMKEQKV